MLHLPILIDLDNPSQTYSEICVKFDLIQKSHQIDNEVDHYNSTPCQLDNF